MGRFALGEPAHFRFWGTTARRERSDGAGGGRRGQEGEAISKKRAVRVRARVRGY